LGIRQVGKATDFDSVIHRFESCIPSHFDPLAQSVEHLTFNQGVPRSSRGWVTIVSKPLRNQAKHYADKPDFNFFYNAPTLVIVTSAKDPAVSSPAADCAAALENIFVAAHSLGVSSCWINLLTRMSDFPEIRELFTKWGIPKNERCYGSAALGYNGGLEKKAAPRREGTVTLVK
jgi:hypothetical protein